MQRNTLLLKEKVLLSKMLLLIILALVSLMLAACHSGNGSEQVVTDFYKALAKNDVTAVTKLIYMPDTSETDRVTSNIIFDNNKLTKMVNDGHANIQKHKGIKKIKTGEVRYSEDKKNAAVSVTVEFKDGEKTTESINTINKDGKWLIRFY